MVQPGTKGLVWNVEAHLVMMDQEWDTQPVGGWVQPILSQNKCIQCLQVITVTYSLASTSKYLVNTAK